MSERSTTVTIKYGKGYEETWAVFRGTTEELREDIVAYFGLDGASVAAMTLSELVVNVTNLAHGKGNVAATLGATAIPSSTSEAAQAEGSDPWAAASASPTTPAAEPAVNPIFEAIKGCTTRDELKRLWAENQPQFADAAVMDAWKARGKELSA